MEEEDETKSKRVRLDVATKLQIMAAVEGGQLQLDVAKQFGVKPKSKFRNCIHTVKLGLVKIHRWTG